MVYKYKYKYTRGLVCMCGMLTTIRNTVSTISIPYRVANSEQTLSLSLSLFLFHVLTQWEIIACGVLDDRWFIL